MTTLGEWEKNRKAWHELDYNLMTSDEGFSVAAEKDGITIWRRPFPDDKNHLFKWVIKGLKVSHTELADIFTNQFHQYHQYWTKEYTGGYDPMIIDEEARLSYQQYDSGIPLISNRDWLVIQWSRVIDPTCIQLSFRTIKHDKQPPVKGYERIDWWGSHLFEANADGTSNLYFIDRENQGGYFPAFLMNRMMPKYLIFQYKALIEFFEKGGTATHPAMTLEENSAKRQGLF